MKAEKVLNKVSWSERRWAKKYMKEKREMDRVWIQNMMKEQARAEGLAEGKAEGLAEGKAEGLAEGKAKGREEGQNTVLELMRQGYTTGQIEAKLAAVKAEGSE
jgi:flagellar biosynthesis/type III secretory pathway protein FliH